MLLIFSVNINLLTSFSFNNTQIPDRNIVDYSLTLAGKLFGKLKRDFNRKNFKNLPFLQIF
jgi:hypothetical protein